MQKVKLWLSGLVAEKWEPAPCFNLVMFWSYLVVMFTHL